MELNETIRTMRKINHLTQEEMAEKLDISVAGYSKIENGKTIPNVERLKQIANIFNIELSDLLTKDHTACYVIGDNNSNNNLSPSYICGNEALALQIEKLKLEMSYKDKIIERLESENATLKEMVELLKSKS